MYMHTYARCGYTRHVNRPSGISQAAAVAVNRTQGVQYWGIILQERLYLHVNPTVPTVVDNRLNSKVKYTG